VSRDAILVTKKTNRVQRDGDLIFYRPSERLELKFKAIQSMVKLANLYVSGLKHRRDSSSETQGQNMK
jgi:hypothetical protein